jgi:glycosyltransferase 2 family protein
MRKFLFAVVLLVGVIFFIGRLAEVQTIYETLQRGDWRFLFLALLVQSLWFFNVAASYCAIFNALRLQELFVNLLPMSAAANFINVVAPSGGISGMAVFISAARQRDYSPARATVAGALSVFFDYVGFLIVLTFGLAILFRRDRLDGEEIAASAVILGLALGQATLFYLGARSSDHLGRFLTRFVRLINRLLRPFLHRDYLSEKRAYSFASDISGGIQMVLQTPKKLIIPAILGLSKHLVLIAVLYLTFLAFRVDVSPLTVVAGYSIGTLFVIVSPTPAGLGVVEGMMTLGLRSMNVPIGAAAVVTLAYRGFTFWIPFFIGLVSFRLLDRLHKTGKP